MADVTERIRETISMPEGASLMFNADFEHALDGLSHDRTFWEECASYGIPVSFSIKYPVVEISIQAGRSGRIQPDTVDMARTLFDKDSRFEALQGLFDTSALGTIFTDAERFQPRDIIQKFNNSAVPFGLISAGGKRLPTVYEFDADLTSDDRERIRTVTYGIEAVMTGGYREAPEEQFGMKRFKFRRDSCVVMTAQLYELMGIAHRDYLLYTDSDAKSIIQMPEFRTQFLGSLQAILYDAVQTGNIEPAVRILRSLAIPLGANDDEQLPSVFSGDAQFMARTADERVQLKSHMGDILKVRTASAQNVILVYGVIASLAATSKGNVTS